MEIIATTLGYQPHRLQGARDLTVAEAEVARIYDLKRAQLLHEWHEAIASGKEDDRKLMIAATKRFNEEAKADGFPGRQVSNETIQRSVEAQAKTKELHERGLPSQKGNYQIFKKMEELYPEGSRREAEGSVRASPSPNEAS